MATKAISIANHNHSTHTLFLIVDSNKSHNQFYFSSLSLPLEISSASPPTSSEILERKAGRVPLRFLGTESVGRERVLRRKSSGSSCSRLDTRALTEPPPPVLLLKDISPH